MESRQIIITSTIFQGKKVINSTAETLGELKLDLDNAGIEYEGMVFLEGLSDTTLESNNSILPKDIMHKGTRTNNLVFYLTKPSKKIDSGAFNRKEAVTFLKENNLTDKVKAVYGKNFTNCSNVELEKFIVKETKIKDINKTKKEKVVVENKVETKAVLPTQEVYPEVESDGIDLNTKFNRLLEVLCLSKENIKYITGISDKIEEAFLSDEELSAMFKKK